MKPKFILLMRHAESLEDVDPVAYKFLLDNDMPLTEIGKVQAIEIGIKLKKLFGQIERAAFFFAPINRVDQTVSSVVRAFEPEIKCTIMREPFMMKQNWGNITLDNKREIDIARYEAGVLRYNFPGGESGPQFLARFDAFVKSLWNRFDDPAFPELALLVTHGFEMRVLLKIIFGWSEDYFETLAHPHHCEYKILALQSDDTYKLLNEMRILDPTQNPCFIRRK